MESLTVDRIDRKVSILEQEREREKAQVGRFDQVINHLKSRKSEELKEFGQVKGLIIEKKSKNEGRNIAELQSLIELLKKRKKGIDHIEAEVSDIKSEREKVVTQLLKKEKIINILNEKGEEQKSHEKSIKLAASFEENAELYSLRKVASTIENKSEVTEAKFRTADDKANTPLPEIDRLSSLIKENEGTFSLQPKQNSELATDFASRHHSQQHETLSRDQGRQEEHIYGSEQCSKQSSKKTLENFQEVISRVSSWHDIKGKGVSLELKSPNGHSSLVTINEISPKVVSVEIVAEGKAEHTRLIYEQREIIATLKRSGITVKNFTIKGW